MMREVGIASKNVEKYDDFESQISCDEKNQNKNEKNLGIEVGKGYF